MKFLLVGHGGCYNRGCEAIVRTTLAMLRKEFGTPEITISSFDYINEKSVDYGQKVKIIPARSFNLWKRFTKDWTIRQFYRVFGVNKILELVYSPIIPFLKNADVVLSIGGDNYTLDYNSLSYFLKLNKVVKKFKKKLVLWGVSIGPFPQDNELENIIDNLKMADLITVRESESFKYLKSLGIVENIRLVADPAFTLPTMDTVGMDNFFQNTKGGVLGFNISPILEAYTDKGNNDDIGEECVLFLRKVIKELGLYVLLIPHVAESGGSNNDYILMENIYKQLKDTQMINRVTPDYNAMQMKYIISKCRFFIGARTHSTIAALSARVPTLSIGYSLKAKGINEDIFGNYNFLLDIKDFSAEKLFHKFMNVYTHESEIRGILSKEIPEFKKRAWANIEYLKEIL